MRYRHWRPLRSNCRLWKEFEAACDYVPVAAVPEARQLFSEFAALPL